MRILGAVATGFIEVVRGVPLITLLFVGHFLFPLFLPQGGLNLDAIFRAGLALTVFLSVYSAEVWRGGFLAIHKGQEEAASALGLRGPQKLRYVLLPQATRVALPGLVATFIGLFKDTSLVTIVGVFDLLGVVRAIPRSSAWLGVDVEPFVFAAAVYAGIGILMTRLGRSLSSKWST
jgi:general L-amino acid transport system permease protein